MKQIRCEMCGSNKLIKKDGVYECQYCGCQYTVEEAKKLIIDGTVRIDDSDKDVTWVKLADAAYDNSNWKEAYTYYCKVVEVYPDEWRSIYRKALTIGWQSTLANIHVTETLGGLADGVKALLDSENTDEFKAWGIVAVSQDLLSWVEAVQNASVKHALEYTKTLERACYDYYNRSVLMASAVQFAISLLDRFVVMNIKDLDITDSLYNTLLSASRTVITSLSTKFRPLVGKKYSTFWKAYFDDYRNVSPTEAANSACSKLAMSAGKLKQDYPKWRHERLLDENPDYDKEVKYKKALKQTAAADIKSLEEAVKLFNELGDYKDAESLALEYSEKIVEAKYNAAKEKMKTANIYSLKSAIELFDEIPEYKDSSILVDECQKSITELMLVEEKNKKRFIVIALIILVAFVVFMLSVAFPGRNTKFSISLENKVESLDMSTSLIKDSRIIPANEAYELITERILEELGDDYYSTIIDDGVDAGSVGIVKDGDTRYTYIVSCSAGGNNNRLSADSDTTPANITIVDCTRSTPNPDSVAKIIGFLVDNETSSTILPILKNRISRLPNKTYPRHFFLSLNRKGFYLTCPDSADGYYIFAFDPEYYEYTKNNPYVALFLLLLDRITEDELYQLTESQVEYLLDYHLDHESEYFTDLDSLIEQSGMNDMPDLSVK